MSQKKTRTGHRPLPRSSTMSAIPSDPSPISSSLAKEGKGKKRNSKTATFLTDLDSNGKGKQGGGRKDSKGGVGRRSKSPDNKKGVNAKQAKNSQAIVDDGSFVSGSYDGYTHVEDSQELSCLSHPLAKREPLSIEEKIAYRREQLRVSEEEGEWSWRATEKLAGRDTLTPSVSNTLPHS